MSAIDAIKAIEAEIQQRYERIRAIRDACDHDWQPSNPKWLDASHPRCVECGSERSGWWCEESPTKTCDYFDPNRPSRYAWNFDCCRYCGNPEERK